MKLTPRLQTIADMVPENTVVGDVGTDHGYVPIYLVQNGISKKAVASDINEGPTNNARRAVGEEALSNQIDVRLGGGLLPYKAGEVDVVIIAGMGGLLIRDILIESPEVTKSVKTFILQPMVAQDELRKWLIENNFKIIEERLSKEAHRIYEILRVEHGHMEVEDTIQYELGFDMLKKEDDLSAYFLEGKMKQTRQIIRGLESSNDERAKERIEELVEKLKKMEAIRECM